MSQAKRECPFCDRPTGDAFVCQHCVGTAGRDLRTIAYLARGLDEKRARRSAITMDGGSAAAETPLPFDSRVTRVADPILWAIQGTCRIVIEGRPGVALPTYLTGQSIGGMALWLTQHLRWLAGREEGPDEFDSIRNWRANLETLLDGPPDQLYIGTCSAGECTEAVYVEAKNGKPDDYAKCRRCSTQHEVAPRREVLREGLADYQATMREVLSLRHLLGVSAGRSTLYMLAETGRLEKVGKRLERNSRGEWRKVDTFRLGSVAGVVNDWATRRTNAS